MQKGLDLLGFNVNLRQAKDVRLVIAFSWPSPRELEGMNARVATKFICTHIYSCVSLMTRLLANTHNDLEGWSGAFGILQSVLTIHTVHRLTEGEHILARYLQGATVIATAYAFYLGDGLMGELKRR